MPWWPVHRPPGSGGGLTGTGQGGSAALPKETEESSSRDPRAPALILPATPDTPAKSEPLAEVDAEAITADEVENAIGAPFEKLGEQTSSVGSSRRCDRTASGQGPA